MTPTESKTAAVILAGSVEQMRQLPMSAADHEAVRPTFAACDAAVEHLTHFGDLLPGASCAPLQSLQLLLNVSWPIATACGHDGMKHTKPYMVEIVPSVDPDSGAVSWSADFDAAGLRPTACEVKP